MYDVLIGVQIVTKLLRKSLHYYRSSNELLEMA